MDSYKKSISETEKEFLTNQNKGLSESEAEKRFVKYGPNKLEEKKQTSLLIRFFEQFKDFMIIVLIIAAVISFTLSVVNGENDFIYCRFKRCTWNSSGKQSEKSVERFENNVRANG